MMSTGDRVLICRDCGNEFIFTEGEQAFYAERGFDDPARCPACRASRRQARSAGSGQMSAFSAGGQDVAKRAERKFYPAICAECGKETMVPFEPRTGRPVYCRECYQRLQAR